MMRGCRSSGTGLCSKRCTARGMKRRTTQQAASQLRRLPTTVGGAPKYLESLHQLLFRFGSRKWVAVLYAGQLGWAMGAEDFTIVDKLSDWWSQLLPPSKKKTVVVRLLETAFDCSSYSIFFINIITFVVTYYITNNILIIFYLSYNLKKIE